MKRIRQATAGILALLAVGHLYAVDAMSESGPSRNSVTQSEILPTGFGESVDRDVERVRTATARFKSAEQAVAEGYKATTHCIENPPHGGMGLHFANPALHDSTLDVEKPEILVYEQRDGALKLNGVEYIVPIADWKHDEPPSIMGQSLKRAEKLGIWYLHVWIWEPSPSGLFADWNPRVKC